MHEEHDLQLSNLSDIFQKIDVQQITDTARVSVIWDSFGICVDFNYSYSDADGYGSSELCFCEPYDSGEPDETAWLQAQQVGQLLKEKYGVPMDIFKECFAKFKIGQDVKPSLSEQIQSADAKSAAKHSPVFLFEEDKSGDRMGKPGDFSNVYYANWFEFYSIGAAGVVRKETGSLEFSSQGKRLPGGGEARTDAIQKFADAQIGRDVVVLSIERSNKDLNERISNALKKYEIDHKSIMVLPAWQKSANLLDPTR